MKTNSLFKALSALLVIASLFVACSKNGKDDHPEKEVVTTFDDLEFFQDAFVDAGNMDEYGDYSYVIFPAGEILYENEPTNLYIGVENIDEALQYWDSCLAPDITRTTSADHKYTYNFTDVEGKSQGSVSFAPGTGGNVAVIIPNLAGLKHFSKVTFILNSAWPFNDDTEPRNHVGDIRYFTPPYYKKQMPFVCIRERGNGVTPLFAGISTDAESPDGAPRAELITTKWCPAESNAKKIYNILHSDWDFFVAVFDEAGGGKLDLDQGTWFDKKDDYLAVTYHYAINLTNGEFERLDAVWHNPHRRILMKVDWLDEDALEYVLGEHSGGFDEEEVENLFDGQTGTKWCTSSTLKTESSLVFSGKPCWFVEFQTIDPSSPQGYMMTTTDSAKKRHYRNPKEWALLAKKSADDAWTVLDKRTDSALPGEISKDVYFTFNQTPDGKDWQYYRLEVTEIKGGGSDYCMQFSRFKLTY